jgi:poly(A) polymerase
MKLSHPPWSDGEEMKKLLAALDADKGSTRYVGGCVRDTLLGQPVSDVDFATRLQPQAVLERLQAAKIKAIPTGIAHGTITAILRGHPVEITTLRRDVSTDGRRATVAFTTDWQEDAARRDFTINAISADPISLGLFDYFEGLSDLKDGRVRFIGDPIQRIAEDHLRILRFFRFHARFGRGDPDADALEACTRRANDLMALSRERIADELLKLLAVADPVATVSLMVARGIMRPVLPEIDESGVARLAQLFEREQAQGVAGDAVRRLSALLPADGEIAASVGARLRLSNKMIKRLVTAADRSTGDDPRVLAYRIGLEGAIDRLLLGEDGGGLAERLAGLDGWKRPRLHLGGGDLIAMGVPAGPEVSRLLQAIETEWAASGFPDDKQTVRALAKRHVDQLLRFNQ